MKTLLAILLAFPFAVAMGQEAGQDPEAVSHRTPWGPTQTDHLGNPVVEEISMIPIQAEYVQADASYENTNEAMVLVFNTNLSAGTTITLPLLGEVDVTVYWGDGSQSNVNTQGLYQRTYALEGTYEVSISGSLEQFGKWDGYSHVDKLTEVTSFGNLGLTSLSGAFRGAVNLTKVPDVLPGSVTDLFNLFFDASSFNYDIGGWDVSNVTNMIQVFWDATSFNQDLGGWDVGAVLNMYGLFAGALVFNQDLGGWDVSSATNMTWMFADALAFNYDIGGWDLSSMINMQGLFAGAMAFNQDIGGWNVAGVTDMLYMFYWATTFNQNLSGWCVQKISSMPDDFDTGADAWVLPQPSWGTCPVYSLTLSVIPEGAGSITKNPNQSQYHTGQKITLQATPVVDYEFEGWTGDTEYLDNTQMGSVTLTMPFNQVSLTANFYQTTGVGVPEFHMVDGAVLSGEAACYDAQQTITVSNFLVASGGIATFIAGESIRLLPGTIVEAGGYLHAYITTDGIFCGGIDKHFLEPEELFELAETVQEESPEAELPTELPGELSFKVYPNPTPGLFTLELSGYDQDAAIVVDIYGLRGETILRKELSAAQQLHTLSLEGSLPGMYFIRVLSGSQSGVQRIIKR